MKLKAPKTWQLIVIIASAILLAIGGSFLAVYLKTGFKPVNTPPEEIEVDDVDGVYNFNNSQYEVVNSFRLKITTPTEEVNQKEITLSFPSGIYTTTTDDGKISDGIIIVPEKVNIDETINVELVKTAYLGENGECMINKGGISNLIITTQNKELSSSQIQIAVDVPVVDIKLEAFNATTNDQLTENEAGKIAQSTNFVLRPTFYPEASRYMFSDDQNSAVATKREKRVYYNLDSASEGLIFNYNDGDIYFVAGDEPSANNKINAYSFATASEQDAFDASTSQLAGLPLYTEAIRVLSTSDTASKTQIKIDVVEANVGSFSITATEGSPFNFAVNKLFRLSAGVSTLSDEHISIRIRDVHDNDLSSMIKNVGLRIVSVKDRNTNLNITSGLESYVVVKGGSKKVYDDKEYILINSNVKNLNHANWEISTDGEYDIVAEIKLFVQDENGVTHVYDEATERKVYLQSHESVEKDISWKEDMSEGITMTIVYDKNGEVLSSQYATDLRTLAAVPTDNVYQKLVFFAYYDATFEEGKDMNDYVSVETEGVGMYTISTGENKKLYPLIGGYDLIAKEAIDFNLVFATVRTDAYGNPIMSAGCYIVEKISSKISVTVKKTLQGFSECELAQSDEVGDMYLFSGFEDDVQSMFGYALPYYAVPTDVENAFVLKLRLKEAGDAAIFENEKSKLKFYSSTSSVGTEDAGVFEFGEMTLEGDIVSVPVNVRGGINIAQSAGMKYYVRIEYDNSVKVLDWTATMASGSENGVVIYNQRPNSIENEDLNRKTFTVSQTLAANGDSNLNIQGPDGEIGSLNALINGEGKTIIKDVYGREFEYNYTISSSNSEIVIPHNDSHSITFGSGNTEVGKPITVTLTAGSEKVEFYLNVSTTGIVGIKVNGKDADLSNPKYAFAGEAGTEITLKNTSTVSDPNGLLDVYITGSDPENPVPYDNDAYKLMLTNEPDGIKDVVKFEKVEKTGEVTSFKLLENFGEDVTLTFTASNDQGTLSFTFQVTIQKFTFEETVAFGSVVYGTRQENGQDVKQIGVAEADKGSDANATYVYAAYGIELNTYLKVRLGEKYKDGGIENENYINWDEVFTNYTIKDASGNDIGTIVKGVLTFNDVYEFKQYTFTLNANSNNSKYAYNKDITVVVCPNFKLVQTKELTILSLQKDNVVASYFNIIRKTSEFGENVEAATGLSISGYTISNYLGVEGGKIKITKPLTIGYGETSKSITVSLMSTISNVDVAVSTCDAELSIGVEINQLTNYSQVFNSSKMVKYNGIDSLWVSEDSIGKNQEVDVKGEIEGTETTLLTGKLLGRMGYYSVSSTAISFAKSTSAIVAGNKVYFELQFTDTNKNNVAIWQIPYVYSRVGGKVASYEYDSDSLANADISQMLNNPDTNIYIANVDGGKDYYLIAPFEYYFTTLGEGTDLYEALVILDGEKITINEQNNQIGDVDITFVEGDSALQVGDDPVSILVGSMFIIDKQNYYYKSYSNGSAIIYKAYIGGKDTIDVAWNGEKFVSSEGTKYTYVSGIFGKMLTSLGDYKFLTGLQSEDFKDNVASCTFGTINGQKLYNIKDKLLSINDVVASKAVDTYFEITQTRDGDSLTYRFYLRITPNASAAGNITYPFEKNVTSESTEMLEIATGETLEIDMAKDVFGADTLNPSKTRIADNISELEGMSLRSAGGDISNGATLRIKSLTINDKEISVSNGDSAGNGLFAVSIVEGTKVKFACYSDNAKNVSVVLVREYSNVYGADAEYSFSINSSNITYKIAAKSPSDGSGLAEGNDDTFVWTLANKTDKQTLNITTKQLNEAGGSSNVDVNKVVTVMTHDFDVILSGSTIEYNYKATVPQLSITLPAFVESDKTAHVYFSVNGITISTIDVKIPATVNATQKNAELPAGRPYESDALVELSTGAKVKNIEVVNVDANKPNKYVTASGTSITILNAQEEQEVTLKIIYDYTDGEGKVHEGYVIFTYAITPNVAFKTKLDTQNVVAGEEHTILFTDLQNDTKVNATDFTIVNKVVDSTLFGSIKLNASEGKITIPTYTVSIDTPIDVVLTVKYVKDEEVLFEADITIPFSIKKAVELKVNYPQPNVDDEALTYEAVESGKEYPNFLINTADFAETPRFQAAAAVKNGNNVTYSETYEAFANLEKDSKGEIVNKEEIAQKSVDKVSVVEYSNMSSVKIIKNPENDPEEVLILSTGEGGNITLNAATNVPLNSTFTFTIGTTTAISYVKLQVVYKGVAIDYYVYAFNTVVNATINNTINMGESDGKNVETIYADRVQTRDLFNKNRLLEISVDSTASAGAICYPYVVNFSANGEFESVGEKLLQFKIESSYIGRVSIFVDSGLDGGVNLGENGEIQTVWFLTEQYIAGKSVPARISGVNFLRTAGRIEYSYPNADTTGGKLIKFDKMTVEGTPISTDGNNITSWTVGYKLNKEDTEKEDTEKEDTEKEDTEKEVQPQSTITYYTKTGLDIAVDKAYDATSDSDPEFIIITAHQKETVRLVNAVGMRHPSTGELITAESMGDAILSFSIIDFKQKNQYSIEDRQDKDKTITLQNYILNKNINSRGYVSKNANYDDYLQLHDIKNGDKIYDYYFLALGCAADGDYVLLKITYSLDNTVSDFYVAIKIVSDYVVSFTGEGQNITATQEMNGEKELNVVSNKDNSFIFVPDGEKKMTLAGTSSSIISVVRSAWGDNANISYSLGYTITVNDESKYNIQKTMNKLALDKNAGWGSENNGAYYKSIGDFEELYLQPQEIVFGDKEYRIVIVDDYNYTIHFYFTLKPPADQTPAIYEAGSSTIFIEGESFDVGLLYDKISIKEEETPVLDEKGEPKTGNDGNVITTTTYSAEVERAITPDSDKVKKITLQNIDAWGLASALPNGVSLTDVEGIGDYKNSPLFQNVTVTDVKFIYNGGDRGMSERTQNAKTKSGKAFQLKYGDNVVGRSGTGDNSLLTYNGTTYRIENAYEGTSSWIRLCTTEDIVGTIKEVSDGNNGKKWVWEVTFDGETYTNDLIIEKAEGTETVTGYKLKLPTDCQGTNDGKTYGTDINVGKGGLIVNRVGSTNYSTFTVKDIDFTNKKVVLSAKFGPKTETVGDKSVKYYNLGFGMDKPAHKLEGGVVDIDGNLLATDAMFWPGDDNSYRTIQDGIYEVPIMDGWIYGTGDTATVDVMITLEYNGNGTNGTTESCVVTYSGVTIKRKVGFNINKNIVTDATKFALKDYIKVENTKAGTTTAFYDDTLALTIPAAGQAVVWLNVCDNATGEWKSVQMTQNGDNNYLTTYYISLSEKYGKTLSPKVEKTENGQTIITNAGYTIQVSWYGTGDCYMQYAGKDVEMTGTGTITLGDQYSYRILEKKEGSTTTYKLVALYKENESVTIIDNGYAGSKISVGGVDYSIGFEETKLTLTSNASSTGTSTQSTSTDQAPRTTTSPITMGKITDDTLYIESARAFGNNSPYGHSVTKSYIIGANDTFYQYVRSYTVTPYYAYFNDGLGQAIVKEVKGTWAKGETGYTVAVEQWSAENGKCGAVQVAPATDSESHQAKEGTPVDLASTDLSKLYFTIGVEGLESEATIDELGHIETGLNYVLNSNETDKPQYLLIHVYVRASGGAKGEFCSTSAVKELGQLRIYLTGNEAATATLKSGKSGTTYKLSETISAASGYTIEEYYTGNSYLDITLPANAGILMSVNVNYIKTSWKSTIISRKNETGSETTEHLNLSEVFGSRIWPNYKIEISYVNTGSANAQINLSGTILHESSKASIKVGESTYDYQAIEMREAGGVVVYKLVKFDNKVVNLNEGDTIAVGDNTYSISFGKRHQTDTNPKLKLTNVADATKTATDSTGIAATTVYNQLSSSIDINAKITEVTITGNVGDLITKYYVVKLTKDGETTYSLIACKFEITA